MGTWKPVLSFGNSTIIRTVVGTALQACAHILLVTGYKGAELASLFQAEPRVVIVAHAGWEQGMFSSIQAGAAQVTTRRFFVTLGDMPWIPASVYRALLHHDEADIVFPEHGGRRGHPVLFHHGVRAAIAAADPREGSMRAIAATFPVREMPWPDDAILRDIDTAADLA
jgi:molybdenum cofactor cytidylyltransferase